MKLPSTVVTVTVAVPFLTPVTLPFASTVTASPVTLKVTSLFVASEGFTVTVRSLDSPVLRDIVSSMVTPVTLTGFSTILTFAVVTSTVDEISS